MLSIRNAPKQMHIVAKEHLAHLVLLTMISWVRGCALLGYLWFSSAPPRWVQPTMLIVVTLSSFLSSSVYKLQNPKNQPPDAV